MARMRLTSKSERPLRDFEPFTSFVLAAREDGTCLRCWAAIRAGDPIHLTPLWFSICHACVVFDRQFAAMEKRRSKNS